jgi:SAM-dependent methyltransferase
LQGQPRCVACTSMDKLRKLANRLQGWIEQRFPNWAHRRHRHKWERQWANPEFSPFWKTDQPQRELVEAIASGWFSKNQRVVDVGCGNGEVSRWLAGQGYPVLGIDYSAAAIENCRRFSAGQANAPTFEVTDLCSPDLRLEPAASLVDRGCCHRIAESFLPVFAQNIARATIAGGHFLLLHGTFQQTRFLHYRGARSERELRDHVETVFGNDFTIERAEPAVINAIDDQEAMPAVAFWMVRKSESTPTREAGKP